MPQWIRVLIGEYFGEIKKFGITFRNHFQKNGIIPPLSLVNGFRRSIEQKMAVMI